MNFSMMSFQWYPPEEHLLSPSSLAPPSQAFLSPPPSQAPLRWAGERCCSPRTRFGANAPLCKLGHLSARFMYSSRFDASSLSAPRKVMQAHLTARDEILQFNLLPPQIMPGLQFYRSFSRLEKKGTNNCDGNHSLETSRGNYTPARGKRIIKR